MTTLNTARMPSPLEVVPGASRDGDSPTSRATANANRWKKGNHRHLILHVLCHAETPLTYDRAARLAGIGHSSSPEKRIEELYKLYGFIEATGEGRSVQGCPAVLWRPSPAGRAWLDANPLSRHPEPLPDYELELADLRFKLDRVQRQLLDQQILNKGERLAVVYKVCRVPNHHGHQAPPEWHVGRFLTEEKL